MSCNFGVRRFGTVVLASSAIALWAAVPGLAAGEGQPAEPAPASAAQVAAAPAETPVTADAAAKPAGEVLTPGETPAAVAVEPPPAPAPVVTAAPAVVAPVSDPVELAVRDRLAKPLAGADKADTAALVAFYAARTQGPVWIKDGTFNAQAQAVIATLAKAADWGLDPKTYGTPVLAPGSDTAGLADAELQVAVAALKYARHASGGRVDPSSLSRFNDHRGTFADPSAVLAGLAGTPKPDVYLEALHPHHPQFQKLHEALVKILHGGDTKADAAPETPKLVLSATTDLKPGAKHEDIAAIRKQLGAEADAGNEATYDKALVGAVKAFQEEHGLKANGVITAATRSAFMGGDAKKKTVASTPARDAERIALNMERWRWMPANMGAFHIVNNVPEFQTRVVKDGQVVHQEKIIVGKTNTPTSLFSANMQFVIFHPEWGVPDSIKMKEILPSLRRKTSEDSFFGFGPTVSDTRVLQRHNLRVSYNGRPVDASQIDWTKTDPRAYSFIQPAGGTNVLGVVKFRFPNRHDIYMHDTPQRDLFSQSVRAFSHGCMRVNNPRRLAEVILAEDRGWPADKVGAALAGHGTQEVKLERPFPVHVVYVTAWADADGKLRTFNDLYGHDAKLASALAGKPIKLEDPSVSSGGDETIAQVSGTGAGKPKKGQPAPQKKEASLGDVFNGLFGN